MTFGRGVGVVRALQPGDPQLIGPYRLVGQLGHGGMGRVFLGVSAGGRPVAVKIIRSELAADPDFRARFGQEVAAARRVNGLFTAMVVAAEVDGPVSWLATAYVPGPSLAEAVHDHGPLPAASLLTLAAGLTESLSAIHAAGVVHRDLKPSNVLLAEDGPRVIDFGISRAAEATGVTQTGLVIGSPGFMSPEQAQGHEVGPPCDMFSLGAVLAFAATGQGPFGTGTTPAMLYRVVHGAPNLEKVPAEVRPLIERCLAKDPRQRPTADGLLAEVGALQPAADWLPESIIRAFARDNASGPALAKPRYESAATLTTTAGPAAQVSTGDSRLLAAPAGSSLTAGAGSLPPPPGGAHDQPPPDGRNRPRRRLWRPLVLAWVIGCLLGASAAAGFAVTAFTGHTPTPIQSGAAVQTYSPTPSAPAAQMIPGPSASPSVSPSVSPTAGPSSFGPQPGSASPSPSVHTSLSPSAPASPSRSAPSSASSSTSASASASTSAPASTSPTSAPAGTAPPASASASS